MRYRFTYENGMSQILILIKHQDYLRFKYHPDDTEKIAKEKKTLEKQITSGQQWFTDESPLFKSITTGLLDCNGIHPVKSELLDFD